MIKNGLTNCSNGGKYIQYVGNDEIGVDGRADVDDGVTHIETMGCWRAQIMGGCTSSEEETEKREGREETHVAGGWRGLRSSHTQKVYEGKGKCGRRWNGKKRWTVSYTFFQVIINSGRNSQDPVSQARTRSGVGPSHFPQHCAIPSP